MTTGKIIFATDFSRASVAALPIAAKLAHLFHQEVLLVHVFEYSSHHPHRVPVRWMIEGIRNDIQIQMRDTQIALNALDVKQESMVIDGLASVELPRLVQSFDDPILVLGTHAAGGLDRFLLGSTAEEVLRHANCPVVTVGPHVKVGDVSDHRFHKILYATDFSKSSLAAAKFAAIFQRSSGEALRVLHVADPLVAKDQEDKFDAVRDLLGNEKAQNDASVIEYVAVPGEHVSQTIIHEAEHSSADLLILGVRRASAFATHLGSKLTFQIIAASPCAVLTISS